jgi:hypothetical protein
MLIARHELEDLCHEGLKAKHAAMIFDLANSHHPVAERKMALASVETVSTEMNRKRARLSMPRMTCWL